MAEVPAPHPAPRKRVSGVVVPNAPSRGQRALAWIASMLMRLLALTLRYRVVRPGKIPETPVIFALWHNRLALCMKAYRSIARPGHADDRLAALISASKDGAFLAAILENFRVQPVRGSSSRRGAQALIELTSCAERGCDLAVTPDGPRGPCYVVQDGVLTLAQLTGSPIIPFGYKLSWKISLKSWDRFQIPLPFARCDMILGKPITVPREATEQQRAQLRQQLHDALMETTRGD
ncbi:MAG: hypothetical protein RLY20_2026 [Verrucomicrobiota bacterium]|jgi:lysophospholipid acyltransferase (LPLAT)-like uncharacterized protein